MARKWYAIVAGTALLACVAAVHAGSVSNVIFRIEATNAAGTGFLEFTADQLTYNPGTNSWSWSTGATTIVNPSDDPIAVLQDATLSIVTDPLLNRPYRIDLGYHLMSGLTDTRFVIQSAEVDFGGVLPPERLVGPTDGGARFTASLGITDSNGDGATLLGYGPAGIGAARALYNDGSVVFAHLVNMVQNTAGASGSASQTWPAFAGYATVTDSVYDMRLLVDFTLTANDQGSGTMAYRILPEPAGAACLAFAALLLRRR